MTNGKELSAGAGVAAAQNGDNKEGVDFGEFAAEGKMPVGAAAQNGDKEGVDLGRVEYGGSKMPPAEPIVRAKGKKGIFKRGYDWTTATPGKKYTAAGVLGLAILAGAFYGGHRFWSRDSVQEAVVASVQEAGLTGPAIVTEGNNPQIVYDPVRELAILVNDDEDIIRQLIQEGRAEVLDRAKGYAKLDVRLDNHRSHINKLYKRVEGVEKRITAVEKLVPRMDGLESKVRALETKAPGRIIVNYQMHR